MPLAGLKSQTEAALEMVVVNRLAQIADDPVLHGTPAGDLIGVCGDEDRRNRMSRFDEMPMELNSGHSRDLNVGNQARRSVKER
jgi:hypothetical protein